MFLEWSAEDRAYALAWQQFQDETCGGCGHPLEISTAAHNQFAYAAEVVRCHACAARERAAKKFSDEGGDPAGLMSRMTKHPRT